MKLQKKIAIVTGGAHGIGRAISLGYAREGADLVIADIDLEGAKEVAEEIRTLGRNAVAIETDVTKEEQVVRMVNMAKSLFGKIDILVNNAGRFCETPLIGTTKEQWDEVYNINLKGAFLCTKIVGNLMAEQKQGRIINISSVAGFHGRTAQHAYCAAKAALIAMTMSSAFQLGHKGVIVNAIAPGYIKTDNPDKLTDKDWMMDYKIRRMSVQRTGIPQDIVGPAVFLADEDSAYISGQTIVVDGGMSVRLDACGVDE